MGLGGRVSTRTFPTRRAVDSMTSKRRSPSCTDFAGMRNVSGDFGDQAADGGGVPILGQADIEQLFEAVGFQRSGDDVAVLALAHHLVARLAFIC